MTLILDGTAGLSEVDGSAATPAIRGTDANTGMFFPTADVVALSTNGSERMRINSSGNVGIGTNNPNATLEVARVSAPGSAAFAGGADNLRLFAPPGSAFAEPAIKFQESGTDPGAVIAGKNTQNGAMAIVFANRATSGTTTAITEKMRLDQSGNLGIGTTNPSTRLNVFDASSSVISVDGNSSTIFRGTRYSTDANPSEVYLRKARGTLASPSTVATSDLTGGIFYQAYGGTNFRTIARIDGITQTYTSDSNISGALIFYTNGGSTDVTERMRITAAGNLQFTTANTSILNTSGNPILRQSGSVIQTQYVASGTRVATTFTGFNEPSTAYRVTITPTSTSSLILIRYFIPAQVNSASNILQLFRAFRIVGGGAKAYDLTSRGNVNGVRNPIAGMMNRPWNGFDLNDAMNWQVDVVDFPNTTSAVTYGFETNPEGGNTTYFGYSADNNATWGFDADIVIIVQEIAQ